VHKGALEILNAGDIWIFPLIYEAFL
jgi:hypothetical protein